MDRQRMRFVFGDDQRVGRISRHIDRDEAAAQAVLSALNVAERLGRSDPAGAAGPGTSTDTADPATLRPLLRSLGDLEVLSVVSDELFNPPTHDPETIDPRPFIDTLARVARHGEGRAVVAWFEALAAEGEGRLDVAQAALEEGTQADPAFAPVVDRLAWYVSTRGDAARAAQLWRSLGSPDAVAVDLANVERASTSGAGLGRNDPCWCGSGRKFKQCHLGQDASLPLPERVGWLCRKGVGYVERRGAPAQADVIDIALALATDPSEPASLTETFDDPLAMDLVLTEGGWWAQFLADRGELLPDDEAMLAESWTRVPRTIYEIEQVRPDGGLTVRDLRTGDHLEVTERSFTHHAQPGQLICARAVPDGVGNQLIGGRFEVPPGREVELLAVLEEATGEGDPTLIAEWVAASHRPAVVVDAEGQPHRRSGRPEDPPTAPPG